MSIADRFSARATPIPSHDPRWVGALMAMAVTAAMGGMVDAAAQVSSQDWAQVATAFAPARMVAPKPVVLRWEGKDVDGDGADDFVNPTGQEVRTEDAYGYGHYGASRDGGTRDHKGVDFIARAGQPVKAPISGYVTKIGLAYSGDTNLKFVEIRNPALHYEARVFYVNPDVAEGDSVHVGDVIGTMHTLQDKYPVGMTDHVHLELSGPDGQKFNAGEVLTARVVKPRKRGLG
jgi:murein DD-endopeptidase MepM/ murein hydrolase activator NlpD